MTRPVHIAAGLDGVAAGDLVRLDGDEGRHAVAVRRMRVGEQLDLVDGLGNRVVAEVAGIVGKGALDAHVLEVTREPESEPRLVVVQALAKGDRGETAVETLTEVGVDAIVPWQAARSVVRWAGAKGDGGVQRWRRTAAEAGKQSRRARFPEVADVAATSAVVEMVTKAALAVVLDEGASVPMASLPVPQSGDIVLVVGPEGGIDPAELDVLVEAGAVAARLGPTVLRTSTAGTVAAAALLSRTARWDVQ